MTERNSTVTWRRQKGESNYSSVFTGYSGDRTCCLIDFRLHKGAPMHCDQVMRQHKGKTFCTGGEEWAGEDRLTGVWRERRKSSQRVLKGMHCTKSKKCTSVYLKVWPTREFPGNAAAAQQEVCKTPQRCSKCSLQTPGRSSSSKYIGCMCSGYCMRDYGH